MYCGYFDAGLKIPLLHYCHYYRTDAARFCEFDGTTLWETTYGAGTLGWSRHPLRAGLLLLGLSPYGRYSLGSGAVADSACTMMLVTRQPPRSFIA